MLLGHTELDIKSLSGGERVCVALALRLSMLPFLHQALNFVILDERQKIRTVKAITQRSEPQNNSQIQLVIISHEEIFAYSLWKMCIHLEMALYQTS